MDDFVSYFLAGMIGEELLRKVATRPFGFVILWLMGFAIVTIFAILFLYSLAFMSLYQVGAAPGQSLFSAILFIMREGVVFFFVTMHPWAVLFSLGMGLLFALGYRFHYRNHSKLKQKSVT